MEKNNKSFGQIVSNFSMPILLLLLIVPRFVKDRKKIGVIIQAIYRGNSMIYALPLTQNIYGAKGAVVAAMAVTVGMPAFRFS